MVDNRVALLVDDEPASSAAHKVRLENEGYTVFVAENQAEALSRARQAAPRVIVAHLVTSRLGNLAFITALRSDDACRHIPVVVINDRPDVKVGRTTLHAVQHDSW